MAGILFQIDEHVAALRDDGPRFAAAVERAGPDAAVPTCPDWTVRDLARHLGGVHRWATEVVTAPRTEPWSPDLDDVVGTWPDDAALVGWFLDGHAALVEALAGADPGLACFAFLPAPTPLAMWARRQAHETAVHRVDAELAAGVDGPFDARLAADGVDELLTGFVPRGTGLRADPPRSLRVGTVDVPGDWLVRIGPDGVGTAVGDPAPADCEVTGPAAAVHLTLWNRRGPRGLTVAGDRAVLARFLDQVHVRWA
ncbi:MAG TPA: maleylpyruvate isomerase family mycothiol-dependent enzyme [Acidimicrobiales bacterium]|jgi:uncharacterized protein (TIGR03083 family)